MFYDASILGFLKLFRKRKTKEKNLIGCCAYKGGLHFWEKSVSKIT